MQLLQRFAYESLRKYWKYIAGLSDKLKHGYFEVDLDAAWDTVKNDIPRLKKGLISLKG